MGKISYVQNRFKGLASSNYLPFFSEEVINNVMKFHSSIPEYEPTTLNMLNSLSSYLGLKAIYVKDESTRFGLNAFKGLGASFSVASYIAEKCGIEHKDISFNEALHKISTLEKVTFATATDGNHGKGIAWAAQVFGQKAKVFMPKGSSLARLLAIKSFGADAEITDLNYDDTVAMVAELAKENGWILMQDTAWDGYETIPISIMQGYLTIIGETLQQLADLSNDNITHVFLQSGVGSFPAAIAAAITNRLGPAAPKIIIVEPKAADCFYQSALDPNGSRKRVYGDLNTMMAGLACGDPSPIAWDILKNVTDYFFSCDDFISSKGMRILGNPLSTDPKIISGESGAGPIGLVYEIMKNPDYEHIKKELDLNEDSVVFVINTEGNTDPENYLRVVWDGI